MKKILIALNFDSSAEKVAKAGIEIANAMNADVVLLHVVAEPLFDSLPFNIMGYENVGSIDQIDSTTRRQTMAKNYLTAIADGLDTKVGVRVIVAEGESADTINEYATKEKAEMIIMGSHRYRGFQRVLFSNTSADVSEHAKIPLLTIPIIE